MPRIAPTQYDEQGKMLRGVVHDPTARRMGGVAGHAGLFSTADDLAKFAQALLSGDKILSRLDVEKMTHAAAACNCIQPPRTGLGHRFTLRQQSRRAASCWVFRAHRLYRHIAVDRSNHKYVHHHSYQRSASQRTWIGGVAARPHLPRAVVDSLDLTVGESDKLRLARITGYNESLMAERRFAYAKGEVKAGIDVLEEHAFRELHPDLQAIQCASAW